MPGRKSLVLMAGALLVVAAGTGFLFAASPQLGKVPIGAKKPPILDPEKGVDDPAKLKALGLKPQTDHVLPDPHVRVAKLEGGSAPDFSLSDEKGATVSLTDLAAEKPVLVFFVEKECPCCVGAKPFLERVRSKYADVLNTVAIINTDQAGALKWSKAVTALFPVIADPAQKQSESYGAERGAYTFLVSKAPAKILRAYPGYSESMLADLGQAVAEAAGVPVRPIDTSGAPAKMVTGCLFPSPTK